MALVWNFGTSTFEEALDTPKPSETFTQTSPDDTIMWGASEYIGDSWRPVFYSQIGEKVGNRKIVNPTKKKWPTLPDERYIQVSPGNNILPGDMQFIYGEWIEIDSDMVVFTKAHLTGSTITDYICRIPYRLEKPQGYTLWPFDFTKPLPPESITYNHKTKKWSSNKPQGNLFVWSAIPAVKPMDDNYRFVITGEIIPVTGYVQIGSRWVSLTHYKELCGEIYDWQKHPFVITKEPREMTYDLKNYVAVPMGGEIKSGAIFYIDGQLVSAYNSYIGTKRANLAQTFYNPKDKQDVDVNTNTPPSHYQNKSGVDLIERFAIIRGNQAAIEGCLFNALKYIERLDKKEGNTFEQEIDKAIDYLQRAKALYVSKDTLTNKD